MQIPTWKPGISDKETADIAYHERNLLALHFADGWYYDRHNAWEGYTRVLSIENGKMTFHIPDDFPVGRLPEIAPNWDGHTTEDKWARVLRLRGIIE